MTKFQKMSYSEDNKLGEKCQDLRRFLRGFYKAAKAAKMRTFGGFNCFILEAAQLCRIISFYCPGSTNRISGSSVCANRYCGVRRSIRNKVPQGKPGFEGCKITRGNRGFIFKDCFSEPTRFGPCRSAQIYGKGIRQVTGNGDGTWICSIICKPNFINAGN